MRKFTMIWSMAALMAGSMALPARADLQQSGSSGVPAQAPHATLLARQASCGGLHLRCPAGYAKVCNPANNKCCCAIAGTYH
jgi:hypothetical protein